MTTNADEQLWSVGLRDDATAAGRSPEADSSDVYEGRFDEFVQPRRKPIKCRLLGKRFWQQHKAWKYYSALHAGGRHRSQGTMPRPPGSRHRVERYVKSTTPEEAGGI